MQGNLRGHEIRFRRLRRTVDELVTICMYPLPPVPYPK